MWTYPSLSCCIYNTYIHHEIKRRSAGHDKVTERGREGGRERGREGGRERGREGGREGASE